MTTQTRPAATTGTHASPLEVMRRIFDEGFGVGNPDIVDELCSPDLVEHQFGLQGRGAEAIAHIRDAIVDLHGIVPDISFTIEDHVEQGDTVWVRVHAHGTATGAFFGPPSGRTVDFTVIDIGRIVDGRFVEHWGVPDRFAMLAQTGLLERLG